MVDTNTLIVISTIVQTIVITITLVVFILQFRAQEKAVKESSYQGLMGRYNDLISTLVDKPDLALALFSASGLGVEGTKETTQEDISVYSHLLLAYGIIEEAFSLYQKKWITENEWRQWSAFLERLSNHPKFMEVHNMTTGTFDSKFQNYVTDLLAKNEK